MTAISISSWGRVHHYGYVVDSLEATAQAMVERLGAGPFFVIEHVPLDDVQSGGQPATFDHSSAFGQCGGFAVELMHIHRCEPAAVEHGFSVGAPVLHHLAWARPSLETSSRELESKGIPAWLSASLGDIRFTYQDATATLGHHVEVHQDGPALQGFFEMISSASADWDGKTDPVRPAPM